ncbi:hypothetical protein TOPH_03391 [Tolypocladium ophioglossoides CBS 100239]|uniref:FAR1 domain-containing protein n=1 Tax=Tolypocladium ophioglossoides (strain CBS 100239) TaxID=1163406 RepID=A0A0L0NDH9_TOLOC|nr:hypothetical protein TOPH_03391 [Tolypocladium ophioglossoides CBS 100239]
MDPNSLLGLEEPPDPPAAAVSPPAASPAAASPAAASNDDEEVGVPIPPLPASAEFDTYEALFLFLRDWHLQNGASIVKASTSSRREINGITQPTWIRFNCDRGPKRQSQSAGLRKASTQKLDCPKWTYKVVGDHHNHGQSLDPSAHSLFRRRIPAQQAKERELAGEHGIRAREIANLVRQTDPDHAFFRKKDIYNDRQAIKKERLDGLTATQAFVKVLENGGIKVSTSCDEEGQLEAVFWTYPWCCKIWKKFP